MPKGDRVHPPVLGNESTLEAGTQFQAMIVPLIGLIGHGNISELSPARNLGAAAARASARYDGLVLWLSLCHRRMME